MAPYHEMQRRGVSVDLATLGGKAVCWTPRSLEAPARNERVEAGLADSELMRKAASPLPLEKVDTADYDIVFVAGGHGVCVDLAQSKEAAAALERAWQKESTVLAAVCHGPAALLRLQDTKTGAPLIKDKRLSCFSDEEEGPAGANMEAPVKALMGGLLEDIAKEIGARYESAAAWQPQAVRDGRLVTGQNPASLLAVAQAAMQAAEQCAQNEE